MHSIINSLDDISHKYETLFVDLWGCVHDGYSPFNEAIEALKKYRSKGLGSVVLLTNSPRPRESVEKQLDKIGVPSDCWDTIATSGDSARAAMFKGIVTEKIFHIGPKHELNKRSLSN
jgi:ribonucleotide monophosphatase NagD (HAD superfamily)